MFMKSCTSWWFQTLYDVHPYLGVSKNNGKTPQIIHFNRVFHYFRHPFWGFSPYFWVDTHLDDDSEPILTTVIFFQMGWVEITTRLVWFLHHQWRVSITSPPRQLKRWHLFERSDFSGLFCDWPAQNGRLKLSIKNLIRPYQRTPK